MRFWLRAAVLLGCLLVSVAPRAAAQTVRKAAVSGLRSAPEFVRETLDGQTIRLSQFRGKVVLLNFWATWCAPCVAESPRFSEWQIKFGSQGFQVIGVSMDDDRAPVQSFRSRYRPTYPLVMGDEHLGTLYGGVLSLPVTYLIGPRGEVLARYEGEADLNQMEARIREALRAQKR